MYVCVQGRAGVYNDPARTFTDIHHAQCQAQQLEMHNMYARQDLECMRPPHESVNRSMSVRGLQLSGRVLVWDDAICKSAANMFNLQ